MPVNEPRIFAHKPRWVGLDEIGRDDTFVTFRTKYGRIVVPIKDVDEYRRRND